MSGEYSRFTDEPLPLQDSCSRSSSLGLLFTCGLLREGLQVKLLPLRAVVPQLT